MENVIFTRASSLTVLWGKYVIITLGDLEFPGFRCRTYVG